MTKMADIWDVLKKILFTAFSRIIEVFLLKLVFGIDFIDFSFAVKVAMISVFITLLWSFTIGDKGEGKDGTLIISGDKCRLNFNLDEISAKNKRVVSIKVLEENLID